MLREEMLPPGCDPSSQLLAACVFLACREGPAWALPAQSHCLPLGREGRVVQFQYFSVPEL